jgi:proteic killer suppression protein
MDIEFSDSDIQALCEQQRVMLRKLGNICARKLRTRLADLQAAANVTELLTGHPHPLRGDRSGQFALDLAGGKRLVFEPANIPIPRREDNAIAWELVSKIRIVFIGDYHD